MYQAPVPGRVVRAFDPPAQRWAAGHRGVDLAARPGRPVAAAADGRVTFAGAVAGDRWVTLAHADGVLTSYGPLAQVAVSRGRGVRRGAVLGTVARGHGPGGASLHWGARRDGSYLDPLDLLASWRPALRPPGTQGLVDLPEIETYAPWSGTAALGGVLRVVEGSPLATHPGWPLPPNPNHVIGVAGLGSHTGVVALDLTHLGYPEEQITYLSYAGRTDASGDPTDPRVSTGAPRGGPWRDQLPYGPEATFAGVDAAARRLRDQLRAHHAARPGEAVDLVGHSMGGLVVLHYLLTLHDPADPALPPIAHVVTIASPLEGADLASALDHAADGSHLVRAVADAVAALVGMPRHDDQALVDLRTGSDLVEGLAHAWEQARADRYAGPLATGTQVLTLGGQTDLVVPEHRSDLPGDQHVVLPGGHDHVRLTEASRIVVHAFLADRAVPGQRGGLGHLLSYPLGWGEQLGGALLGQLP